ncbi:chaplin [Streptomyces sp. GMY02]|uniref:chaplin n=1 Tax=Streptomyces sp. GMY02 TaxID=1333528 RepID=UPI001C2BAFBE|nr:chaplin [Streptomyces sp. GMY02]QXE35683.1 chaplin [Streptomyces sp. GMY02]
MKKLKKAGVVIAIAGSLLAAGGGPAFADSEAEAIVKGSPGVLSGNAIQIPIEVPINLCGNTIDILSLLNPAAANTCLNAG